MVREAARRANCASNLKQIGTAILSYHTTHEVLPPAYAVDTMPRVNEYSLANNGVNYPDRHRNGANGFAWGAMLLPYLEQQQLWNEFNFDLPVGRPRTPPPPAPASTSSSAPLRSGPMADSMW